MNDTGCLVNSEKWWEIPRVKSRNCTESDINDTGWDKKCSTPMQEKNLRIGDRIELNSL